MMQYLNDDCNEFWSENLLTIMKDYQCVLYEIMGFSDTCNNFIKMSLRSSIEVIECHGGPLGVNNNEYLNKIIPFKSNELKSSL